MSRYSDPHRIPQARGASLVGFYSKYHGPPGSQRATVDSPRRLGFRVLGC